MIVVESTALLHVLVAPRPDFGAVHELSVEELHAPGNLDLEIAGALSRWRRADRISAYRAESALADFAELAITRHHPAELLDQIVELGAACSTRRASYLALARSLGARLLTADRAFESNGVAVQVRLVGAT